MGFHPFFDFGDHGAFGGEKDCHRGDKAVLA